MVFFLYSLVRRPTKALSCNPFNFNEAHYKVITEELTFHINKMTIMFIFHDSESSINFRAWGGPAVCFSTKTSFCNIYLPLGIHFSGRKARYESAPQVFLWLKSKSFPPLELDPFKTIQRRKHSLAGVQLDISRECTVYFKVPLTQTSDALTLFSHGSLHLVSQVRVYS